MVARLKAFFGSPFLWSGLAVVAMGALLLHALDRREKQCAAHGGEFHYTGRGSGICMRPDAVIKP
jgi:hypothetical protein